MSPFLVVACIDLDENGRVDYVIAEDWRTGQESGATERVSLFIASQNENQILQGDSYAASLYKGQSIGSGDTGMFKWTESALLAIILFSEDSVRQMGPWANSSEFKYIALRLSRNNSIYYGWALLHIEIGQPNSKIVQDFGYMPIPHQPISAGE